MSHFHNLYNIDQIAMTSLQQLGTWAIILQYLVISALESIKTVNESIKCSKWAASPMHNVNVSVLFYTLQVNDTYWLSVYEYMWWRWQDGSISQCWKIAVENQRKHTEECSHSPKTLLSQLSGGQKKSKTYPFFHLINSCNNTTVLTNIHKTLVVLLYTQLTILILVAYQKNIKKLLIQ